MHSSLSRLTVFVTLIASKAFAQDSAFTPAYLSEIPETEKVALAQIVEDDPNDVMSVKKSSLSPEYPLIYKVPLPIPPIKQPSK